MDDRVCDVLILIGAKPLNEATTSIRAWSIQRADPNKHLEEFGTVDAEEREPRFTGDRSRQKSLTRARSP
jgi:hypothetical protein